MPDIETPDLPHPGDPFPKWPDTGEPKWPDNGDPKWPNNGGSERPDDGNGIPEEPDSSRAFFQNGTLCYCDTDLCNEAGGSYLQKAGSSYFTVICVLTLTALMTLSAADDETKTEH